MCPPLPHPTTSRQSQPGSGLAIDGSQHSAPLPPLLGIAGLRLRSHAAPRLLNAAIRRRYRYQGIGTALLCGLAVFYALHPDDALHPLLQHLGVGDDLFVLGLAGRWINSDLEDFLHWEQQQCVVGTNAGTDNAT